MCTRPWPAIAFKAPHRLMSKPVRTVEVPIATVHQTPSVRLWPTTGDSYAQKGHLAIDKATRLVSLQESRRRLNQSGVRDRIRRVESFPWSTGDNGRVPRAER